MKIKRADVLREEYTDLALKKALSEIAKSDGKRLVEENQRLKLSGADASPEAKAAFSKKLEREYAKAGFRNGAAKAARAAGRAAAALAVMAALFVFGYTNVEAFREAVLSFFSQEFSTHTAYGLTGDANESARIGDKFTVSYLPEGYELIKSETGVGGDTRNLYKNAQGKEFRIHFYGAGIGINLDTENARVNEADVNGNEGELIVKNGQVTVIWTDYEAQAIIIIETYESEEEAMKVARGIIKN